MQNTNTILGLCRHCESRHDAQPDSRLYIAVSAAGVAAEYALWTGKPHDVYDGQWDGGLWPNGMGTVGERPEIGPYPQWSVLWLYSGDWRMRQMALGMADLAGSFPGQLRESAAAKRLSRADPAGSSTGLGRTVAITDRPTLATARLTYSYTKPADKVAISSAPTMCTSRGALTARPSPRRSTRNTW